jgi:hypothetical protein
MPREFGALGAAAGGAASAEEPRLAGTPRCHREPHRRIELGFMP